MNDLKEGDIVICMNNKAVEGLFVEGSIYVVHGRYDLKMHPEMLNVGEGKGIYDHRFISAKDLTKLEKAIYGVSCE